MVESNFLSTAQVAQILGVSVASIKRWVDDGTLPAYKTNGGHRRLLLGDVRHFARSHEFPQADLQRLGFISEDEIRNGSLDWKVVYDLLLECDSEKVRELLLSNYHAGILLEELADRILAPALTQIGQDWEVGKIDVYQEHQATRICEEVLFEIKSVVGSCSEDAPLAIGAAPEWDPTVIPNLIIQMVLLENGWDAINLGPSTPLMSLEKVVRDRQPKLLWLSMSHPVSDKLSFIEQFHRLHEAAEANKTAVAIGGRALTQEWRSTLPYTFFGDGISHLSRFARSLLPNSKRRPKGRKPKNSENNNTTN